MEPSASSSSNPKGIVSIITKPAGDMEGPNIAPKPIIPDKNITRTINQEKYEGYIVANVLDEDGVIKFSKVFTEINKKFTTILLYRPTVQFQLYSLIEFELGVHNNKPTVINPILIQDDTAVKTLLEYLLNPDVASETNIDKISIPEILSRFLTVNHVGNNLVERLTNFLRNIIGMDYIVGIIGNEIIFTKSK